MDHLKKNGDGQSWPSAIVTEVTMVHVRAHFFVTVSVGVDVVIERKALGFCVPLCKFSMFKVGERLFLRRC